MHVWFHHYYECYTVLFLFWRSYWWVHCVYRPEHTRSSVSSSLLPHSRLPTPQYLFILLIYSAETAVPPSAAFPVGMTHDSWCTYMYAHTQSCTYVRLSTVLRQVYNSWQMASISTHIQFSSCRPRSHFQLQYLSVSLFLSICPLSFSPYLSATLSSSVHH